MRKITLCIIAVVCALPSLSGAQALRDDPRVASSIHLLELWLDAQRAYEQIPGISMSVVHDQELLWSGGFGYADLGTKTPATPRTIYSICSISKLFTSIAVLQLRDRGRLRLDDQVSELLPWFTIRQAYPDGPPVTVQGILTHSSGLPRESDFPYWSPPDFRFPTREEVIERLSSQETLYPGDTYFQYSNLGLTLAGEIVAQVSGRDYADYVKQNILDPLGLADTRPKLPEELKGGQLATGYGAKTRDGIRNEMPLFQARGIAPAAGFSSTVEDLARFASWQFHLLGGGSHEVLQPNTLREMHRVHWLDPDWDTTWGLGFSVWQSNDKTFVGHGGSCPGYRSQLILQPKEKFAAVFMANASGVNTGMYTERAYEIVTPAIADALESPGTAVEPDPALEKYTGTYGGAPWGGERAVLVWKGELAMVSFPTNDPLGGLVKLKHIEENTFRRVRDDGELGEKIIFEEGRDGRITRVWQNSNFRVKVR
ncbi:serine hydrolase [candidate division KSB1 bacterium]